MKKQTMIAICAAAATVTIASAAVLAVNTGEKRQPELVSSNIPYYSTSNAPSSQEKELISPASSSAPGYVVREYNGHIGIFKDGSDMPEQELGTEVSALPEADRALLAKGISAADDAELRRIIEDYES